MYNLFVIVKTNAHNISACENKCITIIYNSHLFQKDVKIKFSIIHNFSNT